MRRRIRRSRPAWRGGRAPPSRWATGPLRQPENPPGGRPWPRCLLLPSRATSMPAESSRVLAEQAHLRGAHAGIGTRVRGRTSASSQLGMRHGVVIERGDDRASGGANALVDGRAEAGIASVFDDARTRAPCRSGAPGPVPLLSTIITSRSRLRLPGEGLHALQKPRIRSQGGDHHRYEEVRQFLILPCGAVCLDQAGLIKHLPPRRAARPTRPRRNQTRRCPPH